MGGGEEGILTGPHNPKFCSSPCPHLTPTPKLLVPLEKRSSSVSYIYIQHLCPIHLKKHLVLWSSYSDWALSAIINNNIFMGLIPAVSAEPAQMTQLDNIHSVQSIKQLYYVNDT